MSARRQRMVAVVRAVAPSLAVSAAVIGLAGPRTATSLQRVDGAEMALAAARGTLAHPPGFPLYTTLLDVLVGPGVENPYAASAIVSCALTAITAAVLAALLGRMAGDRIVGAAFALAWAAAAPTLRTATDVDVFPLHHLIAVVLVAVALPLLERPSSRPWPWALLLGGVAGLGGATHPIIVLWAPLVVAALWYGANGSFAAFAGTSAVALAGAIVGLAPYLLLPLQWARAPELAFGHVETARDVVAHAMREYYGTLRASARDGESTSYVAHFLRTVAPAAPLFIVAPIVAVGLGARPGERGRVSPRRPLWLGLGLTGMLHGLFLFRLRFPPNEAIFGEVADRFYPSVLLVGALALGAVLGVASSWMRRTAAIATIAAAAWALPASLVAADARQDVLYELYVRRVLEEAPPGAVVMTSGDGMAFGSRYLQAARGIRPDVILVVLGRLPAPWAWTQLQGQLLGLADVPAPERARAVFEAARASGRAVVGGNDAAAPAGIARRPWGISWVWLRPDEVPSEEELTERILAGCASLPQEIARADSARASTVAARELWLAPLEGARAARFSHPALATALERARAGDIEGARAACRHGG